MSPEEEQIYKYQFGVAPYDTPEGLAAAPQWLRDRFKQAAPRPANSTPTRTRVSPSPAGRFLANWALWGVGTFGLGVVLVIVAIVLHDHYALPNAACQSPLGQLGQAFSGTAYYDCSTAATAESAVGPLMFFGVAALVVGGGKMLMGLIGAAVFTKDEVARQGRQASRPGPAAAGPVVAGPVVPGPVVTGAAADRVPPAPGPSAEGSLS